MPKSPKPPRLAEVPTLRRDEGGPKSPNSIAVDRTKLYPPIEAITLAQQTARNRFDGKIEAHLVVKSIGKLGAYKTERKAPLIHTVLGKQSEKPEKLSSELEKLIKSIDPNQITKLVVCATMGPSIKVDYQL